MSGSKRPGTRGSGHSRPGTRGSGSFKPGTTFMRDMAESHIVQSTAELVEKANDIMQAVGQTLSQKTSLDEALRGFATNYNEIESAQPELQERRCKEISGRVADLTTGIAAFEKSISLLKSKKAEMEGLLSSLNENLGSNAGTNLAVMTLTSKIKECETAIQKMQQKSDSAKGIKGSLEELKDKWNSRDTQITGHKVGAILASDMPGELAPALTELAEKCKEVLEQDKILGARGPKSKL